MVLLLRGEWGRRGKLLLSSIINAILLIGTPEDLEEVVVGAFRGRGLRGRGRGRRRTDGARTEWASERSRSTKAAKAAERSEVRAASTDHDADALVLDAEAWRARRAGRERRLEDREDDGEDGAGCLLVELLQSLTGLKFWTPTKLECFTCSRTCEGVRSSLS